VKLLLASDLHNDTAAAESLVKRSRSVDVVVIAGDLCNIHRGLDEMMDVLRDITTPTVLVAGNNETTDELCAVCFTWNFVHILHGTGCDILGVPFFGVGGGIPITPFGAWSYDFDEQQAALLLADCPSDGVLVVHSPPKGLVDVSSRGGSIGSESIRKAVEQCVPKLVVCGHVHGSNGQTATLGTTTIVNAGPTGMVVEIEG
jgi:uncharacterized protein